MLWTTTNVTGFKATAIITKLYRNWGEATIKDGSPDEPKVITIGPKAFSSIGKWEDMRVGDTIICDVLVVAYAYKIWNWNDKNLRVSLMPEHSARYLSLTLAQLQALADSVERQGHEALAAATTYRKRVAELELTSLPVRGS